MNKLLILLLIIYLSNALVVYLDNDNRPIKWERSRIKNIDDKGIETFNGWKLKKKNGFKVNQKITIIFWENNPETYSDDEEIFYY